MDFDSYQKEALRTDRMTARAGSDDVLSLIVPMLGLAGETGHLLSEYKKHLRDGEAHRLFKERVSEELGDLPWYVANVASKFDLTLDGIAAANLAKVKAPAGFRSVEQVQSFKATSAALSGKAQPFTQL